MLNGPIKAESLKMFRKEGISRGKSLSWCSAEVEDPTSRRRRGTCSTKKAGKEQKKYGWMNLQICWQEQWEQVWYSRLLLSRRWRVLEIDDWRVASTFISISNTHNAGKFGAQKCTRPSASWSYGSLLEGSVV